MRGLWIATFILWSSHSWSAASIEIKFPVEKYQLSNGLTVVLVENHSAPIVSYQTWFRVGSKDEQVGATGLAHLFEHMMFKGAERYTREAFEKTLRTRGATNNAFTSHDYTGYYINIPSSYLEVAMDMESDRLESLQITDVNLKSEREVVKEERRYRVENSPMGLFYEALYGNVFTKHSYRWPVIGWMKDLNEMTVETCREFFHRYYAPNNAVVVVSGDFEPSHVKKLISKYYGSMKSSDIKRPAMVAEPEQLKPRYEVIKKDVANDILSLSYRVPKSGQPDVYVLDILSGILGEGESSRLHKILVRELQIADSVSVFNDSNKDYGIFTLLIKMKSQVRDQASRDKVYSIIEKELNQVAQKSVTEEELLKAKNQGLMGVVEQLKTIHGRGYLIAINEIVLGSYDRLFTDLKRYELVSRGDISRVSQIYFKPEKEVKIEVRKL